MFLNMRLYCGNLCNEYCKAHSCTHRKWFSLPSKRNCCIIKLNVSFASLSSNIFGNHTFLFQTSFVIISHLGLLLFRIKNINTKSFLLLYSFQKCSEYSLDSYRRKYITGFFTLSEKKALTNLQK